MAKALALLSLPLLPLVAAHRPLGKAHDHSHVARSWKAAHPDLAALDRRAKASASGSASGAGATGNVGTPTKTTCPNIQAPAGLSAILANFPKASGVAQIVSGDTTAQNLYNQILNTAQYKTALAFPPAGSNMGDFSGVTYDLAGDPKCWWTGTTCHSPKQSYLSTDTYYCPEGNTWGLTFDDGPFCDNEDFYNFLSAHKLKATMFYIGIDIYNNPVQAQRGLDQGHELCVHTWSHHYMTSLTNEQVFAELYYTKKIMKDVIGVTPTCWRPPFGDVDDRIRTIAYALGMRTVIWNHDTFDWTVHDTASPAQVAQNYQLIFNNATATSGEIVLTHELNADTIQLFMDNYPKLAQAYKYIVPVASCMNITHPYVETNISYPSYSDFISGKIDATHQSPFISNADLSIVTNNPASTGGTASKTGGANNAGATNAQGAAGRGAAVSMSMAGAAILAVAAVMAL